VHMAGRNGRGILAKHVQGTYRSSKMRVVEATSEAGLEHDCLDEDLGGFGMTTACSACPNETKKKISTPHTKTVSSTVM
jgi:hypothetical protein